MTSLTTTAYTTPYSSAFESAFASPYETVVPNSILGNPAFADSTTVPWANPTSVLEYVYETLSSGDVNGLDSVTASTPAPTQSTAIYDTSTAVDPPWWSHIPDPTYGGLTPPPPGFYDAASVATSSGASSRRRNRSRYTRATYTTSHSFAQSEPVQSSYDTSTAVDPSTWSHISDPTYGGLTPPPPSGADALPTRRAYRDSGHVETTANSHIPEAAEPKRRNRSLFSG